MARVELEADCIGVHLNPVDEILALHGSLHIPWSHICSVVQESVPHAWCRGFRIGTNVPGVKVAGTFYNGDGVVFYDFHDPDRCLTLELEHETYKLVVIEVNRDQDAHALAEQIRRRLE